MMYVIAYDIPKYYKIIYSHTHVNERCLKIKKNMDIWYDHISQNYENVIHEYTIIRDIGIVITVIGYL
jgi:hypothetical protein